MRQLTSNVKILSVAGPTAGSASTDAQSSIVDLSGFGGACFMVTVTDSAATGVATLKIETGNESDGSDFEAVTATSATATCAVDDDLNDKMLIAELTNPLKRYVAARITSETAIIAFGPVTALLHSPNALPVDNTGSTVLDVGSAIG